MVSKSEGEKMSKSIKSIKYVECSAKTGQGMTQVFDDAIRAVLYGTKNKTRKFNCSVL